MLAGALDAPQNALGGAALGGALGNAQPAHHWRFADRSTLRDERGGIEAAYTRGTAASYVGPNKQITWAGNYFTESEDLSGDSLVGVTIEGTAKVVIDSAGGVHRPVESAAGAVNHKAWMVQYIIEHGAGQYISIYSDAGGGGGRVWFDIESGTVETVENDGIGLNTVGTISSFGTGPNGGAQWLVTVSTVRAETYQLGVLHYIYFSQDDGTSGSGGLSFTGNGTDHFYVHRRQYVPGHNMPPYVASTGGANLDAPRFAYDPVTGAALGLFEEEARTNHVVQSIDFTQATWVKTNTTITANNAVAPDGTNTADKVQHTTSSATLAQTTGLTTSGNVCVSLFVIKGEHQWFRFHLSDGTNKINQWYNLTAGTLGIGANGGGVAVWEDAGIEDYGDYWRVFVVGSAMGAAALQVSLQLATGNGSLSEATATPLHVWGFELEQSDSPSSPIITDAATITRSEDLNSADASFPLTHSVVLEARTGGPIASGGFQYLLNIGNGNSTTDRVYLYRNDADTLFWQVQVSGSLTVQRNLGVVADNTDIKVAWRHKTNDFAISLDGAAVSVDTFGSFVATLSRIHFAKRSTGGRQLMNGLKSVTIYDTALPNDQLEALAS